MTTFAAIKGKLEALTTTVAELAKRVGLGSSDQAKTDLAKTEKTEAADAAAAEEATASSLAASLAVIGDRVSQITEKLEQQTRDLATAKQTIATLQKDMEAKAKELEDKEKSVAARAKTMAQDHLASLGLKMEASPKAAADGSNGPAAGSVEALWAEYHRLPANKRSEFYRANKALQPV